MSKRAISGACLACLVSMTALSSSCAESPTSLPGSARIDRGTLEAKSAGVSVGATDPSSAEQGVAGLDVRVIGSGFEPGSDVRFLLDRKETADITTNSTTFVSDTEVVANIDVAATAEPALFDVKVETPRGRKGIGIELFEVTGTPQECQLDFDLTLAAAAALGDDGSTLYEHGVDRVAAFTGSAPGFRFDTNGSQKLEARNDRRHVRLDLDGSGWEAHAIPEELKGIDVRFDDPGLNLCTMNVGASATVSLDVAFLSSLDGERLGLKYGGVTHRGLPCDVPAAWVTRTAERVWTVTAGPGVCLVREGFVLGVASLSPIGFSITSQDPVP